MRHRPVIAFVAIAILLAGSVTLGPRVAGATGPACGRTIYKSSGVPWTCTFADDFSGPTLDRNTWQVQTTEGSGFTTGPSGSQACYRDATANVAQTGGHLVLTARREAAPFTCPVSSTRSFTTGYTSGMVSTYGGFSQQYGRFEVRAKLPSTSTPGLQETLWLWPQDPLKYGAWPASGEIDFAEFYSQYPTLNVPYLHYAFDASTLNLATNTNLTTVYNCAITTGAYNTYAAEWLPGRITILVNGRTCLVDNYTSTVGPPPAPFDQPFFPALTQGLGVGTNAFDPATTPLPASTVVDYVHVWR